MTVDDSDHTAPVADSITYLGPDTFDISHEDQNADFLLHITDAGSGWGGGTIKLQNQRTGDYMYAGPTDNWTPETGTLNDGTFRYRLRLTFNPASAGPWTVVSCRLSDRAGNATPATDNACPTTDATFSVTVDDSDHTAPVADSITYLGPDTFDISHEDQNADFLLHITDAGSGWGGGTIKLQNQRTGDYMYAGPTDNWTPETGTLNDGTFRYRLRLTFNPASAGPWTVVSCRLSDRAGNATPATDNACPTTDATFSVTVDDSDHTAPVADSITYLGPDTFDISHEDQNADFLLHITDAGSGWGGGTIKLQNQRTGDYMYAGPTDNWTPETGTLNDGTFRYRLRLTFNPASAGPWTVVSCRLSDRAGNATPATDNACPTSVQRPGPAKLSLSNSVSPAQALPDDTVTYTLTATNGAGAGDATGTAVTDVLPAGVTFLDASDGCTNTAGTVRCELGTVAAGTSRTATIRATVDPMPMRVDPNTAHQVLEQKAETDLRVERGETRTATATCPTGYFATDGGIRLDAVDQGGDVARTSVPASGATADGTGWTATLANDNPGATLAKVTVACLARTTVTGEHQHDLVTSTATAADQPLAAGATTVTVDCAPGQTPFAPSYDVGSGVRVTASRAAGSSWTFEVEAANAGTGDFSVGCLDPRTTSANGHYHVLGIEQRSQTVTVPAGQTVETQLTCADEAKGIVASRRVDAGLVDRGTDPRAKIRAFRFTNPTDHALSADLGLTCLDIRTSGEPVSTQIRNTATVSTTAADATTADDSATATFTAYGDGWAILPTGTAAVGSHGRSVSVPLRCASACSVTARITGAGGKVLGSGRAHAAAGATARLTVRTTKAGAKALAGHRVKRAKVVVRTSDGATYSRVVRLHR